MNYHPTREIMRLIAAISEELGGVIPVHPEKILWDTRKRNRINSIHATMQLEGKLLSREMTAAVADGILFRGPRYRIQEVTNLLSLYESLNTFNPFTEDSIFLANKRMVIEREEDEMEPPGQYRTIATWIFRGQKIIGEAPPPEEVPGIMNDLFAFLNNRDENILIKACMAHYILESAQPFPDGNGMMGRFWQTLLMIRKYPIFEFLPYEKILLENRREYHGALHDSETAGHPTPFIGYMLQVTRLVLKEWGGIRKYTVSPSDRILYFHKLGMPSFTRRDYMKVNRNISTATASRDLEKGVNAGLFEKRGTGNATIYSCQKP